MGSQLTNTVTATGRTVGRGWAGWGELQLETVKRMTKLTGSVCAFPGSLTDRADTQTTRRTAGQPESLTVR